MSDLIEREDAIKAVWGEDINPSGDGMVFEAQSHIDRDIRLIPTADRPQGEWILLEPRYAIEQKVYWNEEQRLADTKGNGAQERRKCSCCGYTKQFSGYMKDKEFKLWNFCPNCGAKMKGADDETC